MPQNSCIMLIIIQKHNNFIRDNEQRSKKKRFFLILLTSDKNTMGADYIWKSLLSEFLATFILVFAVASAVALTAAAGGTLLTSAFAYGLALLVVIYLFSNFSGAHANPAVSFGFAVAGQMNWGLMFGYWIAQLLGAIAAAGIVAWFFGTATGAGASVGTLTNTDAWKALLVEAFLTMFLVLAYLMVYRNPMLAMINGLAVGLVLTFAFIAGGSLTGASTNPARSFGPAIFSNNLGTIWIYIIGPLLGALVGALVYKLITADFNCRDKTDECGNKILDECGNPLKECKRAVVDNCGNEVKDCDGTVYEYYTTHGRKHVHVQETPMLALGGWMSEHGFDPRYIRQEVGHAVKEVLPEGVVSNPQAVVHNAVRSATQPLGNIMAPPATNSTSLPSLQSLSPVGIPAQMR